MNIADKTTVKKHRFDGYGFVLVSLVIGALLLPGFLFAAPAMPQPVTVGQPDGSVLKIRVRGDEFRAWTETEEGYTVIKNDRTKFWEYGRTGSSGDIEPSGIVVTPAEKPPQTLQKHQKPGFNTEKYDRLKKLLENRRAEVYKKSSRGRAATLPGAKPAQGFAGAAAPSSGYNPWDPLEVPLTGTQNLLVVMVNFSNKSFVTTPDSWNSIIFNTTPGAKSLSNFYKDNSAGMITFNPVNHTQPGKPKGIVAVTLSQAHPNSKDNFNYDVETAWITSALSAASGYVNFPSYDLDGDGYLGTGELNVYFIVAGYESATGPASPGIWAHAWSGDIYVAGKTISQWAMNGELFNDGRQMTMGVMTHEMGHSICGLPDLYDTSYANEGLGIFSLMAGGAWGFVSGESSGETPAGLDAWSRYYLGWTVPYEPGSNGETLTFPRSLDQRDNVVKLVDEALSSKEYFLAENRYESGWDASIFYGSSGTSGLLVLHVDTAVGSNDSSAGPHQGVMAVEAKSNVCSPSGDYGPLCDGHYTNLFFTGNNDRFTYETSPAARLYDSRPVDRGLVSVSAPSTTMSAVLYRNNSAPLLSPIGDRQVGVNELLEFTVSAVDPENGALTYSASALPSGALFDGVSGYFRWTPTLAQSGVYSITFTAADNGLPYGQSSSETITLVVNNDPPVLGSIGDRTVNEGELLGFTVLAADPDGDTLTYSAAGLPSGATLDALSGEFAWTPGYAQSGSYSVTFTVNDRGANVGQSDSETVTITVNNVNRPPILEPIGGRTVNENETLAIGVEAADPDGDALAYSAGELPAGATLNVATGAFGWTPGFDRSGTYDVTFAVTDGSLSASESVTITVLNVNRAPVLTAIGSRSLNEGEGLAFTLSAVDADGDALVYSATGLPQGANFNPTSKTFDWTPGFDQEGSHTVTFAASDGALGDNEEVTVTVVNVNRAPVLTDIRNKAVNAGETLSFTVTADDPDGDSVTFYFSSLPAGALFNAATGEFAWTPGEEMSGNDYKVIFGVSDGGSPNLGDSEEVVITVGSNVNRPPELSPLADQAAEAGQNVSFTVSAIDPEGGLVTYQMGNKPVGASFDNATGAFGWTAAGEGNYLVTITATDSGVPPKSDTGEVNISVGGVNRPPVLSKIGNRSIKEFETLELVLTASDPDSDVVNYSASLLPANAALAGQLLAWTPDYGQAGSYPITLTATDGGFPPAQDSETIVITVGEVNPPPVLSPIGPKQVNENEPLEIVLSATDPDGDALTFSAVNLPPGATLGADTGIFNWLPGFTDTGNYRVTFTVRDNDAVTPLTDGEEVTITVGNVNRPPILTSIGNQSVTVGSPLSLTVTAADPDGDAVTYGATSLPAGAVFEEGEFYWTPGDSQEGAFSVIFVSSDGDLTDSETVTISVYSRLSGGGAAAGCFIESLWR
ncbi:tandem-95 repeat protein [bacterium]|nr:MAG: tandem-95 repeat protein [bacterium]